MAKADLTAQRLRELLNYDADTGIFGWRTRPYRTSKNGKRSTASNGYINMSVLGRQYHAHRLAWLYVTGEWPKHSIDHIDGNRANNAFANLRDVPHTINCQNLRKKPKNGRQSTNLLGICWDRTRGKWRASIKVAGKTTTIGRFDAPEQAHAAYVEAKRKLHPGCTL